MSETTSLKIKLSETFETNKGVLSATPSADGTSITLFAKSRNNGLKDETFQIPVSGSAHPYIAEIGHVLVQQNPRKGLSLVFENNVRGINVEDRIEMKSDGGAIPGMVLAYLQNIYLSDQDISSASSLHSVATLLDSIINSRSDEAAKYAAPVQGIIDELKAGHFETALAAATKLANTDPGLAGGLTGGVQNKLQLIK